VIQGKLVHRAEFGVFVELEDGVEGLVHHSELVHEGSDWATHYNDGDQVTAEIINVDPRDRKVSLSERAAVERAKGGDMKEVLRKQGDSAARLGDIMGDLGRKMRERSE
jgi:small subunit ribosomal protein S1